MSNAHNAFVAVALLAVMTSAFEAGANLHAQTASSAPEKAPSRMDRLEAWVAAVAQRVPGVHDSAVLEIARWNAEQLRGVWIDVSTLITPRAQSGHIGVLRAGRSRFPLAASRLENGPS